MKHALALPLVSPQVALSQTEAVPFIHEKLYALPSGKKVAVQFRERACMPNEGREVDESVWGMNDGVRRLVTAVLRVSINGKEFAFPQKFYRDLANTHRVNVTERQGRVIVELKGGEAAGKYSARFLLGGSCGFERHVCGEVCTEIWERTTWQNSFIYEAEPKCRSDIN